MDIKRKKKWRCVVCGKGIIEKSVIEHTYEGPAPDVSNCDLSGYSDPKTVGGRLFEDKPEPYRADDFEEFMDKARKTKSDPIPGGGICNKCLKKDHIKKLIPHIKFES